LIPALRRARTPIKSTVRGMAYMNIIMKVLLSEAGINPLNEGIAISMKNKEYNAPHTIIVIPNNNTGTALALSSLMMLFILITLFF